MSSNTNMTLMTSAAPNTNMMDELDPLAIGMKQFNTNILDTTISKIDFVQYFQQAHLAIFPNVDIPFMNYFMKIARSIRKFVIPHQKLIDYGVMTTEKSSNVRRCLERDNNLVIDTDFILLPPGQQIPTDDEQKEDRSLLLQLEQQTDDEQKEDGKSYQLEQQTDDEKKAGRGKPKKQYVLTVRAFKKCLTKSRNTQRYLDYFLLLEQVISYYKDYCTRYHEDNNNNTLVIRHLCGNSACIAPNHLELGTNKQNMKDKHTHGTALIGEKSPSSKITEEIAKQIKHSLYELTDPNYKSKKERALLFNTTIGTVHSIDKGLTWKHIPDRDGNLVNVSKGEEMSQKRMSYYEKAKNREWTDCDWNKANDRLRSKVSVSVNIRNPLVDTPCHEWTGATAKDGYGTITIFGRIVAPHILSCEIKNKHRRPDGMVTRHLCANKICCNPDHLEWGTSSENAVDRTKHGSIKTILTEAIVKEIRETKGKDGLTHKERSIKYCIDRRQLYRIENGTAWKHVT